MLTAATIVARSPPSESTRSPSMTETILPMQSVVMAASVKTWLPMETNVKLPSFCGRNGLNANRASLHQTATVF